MQEQISTLLSHQQLININLTSTSMPKDYLLLIALALILSLATSQACTSAAQSDCGAAGSTCQYFTWVNGTCVAPTSCPTSPTVTIWSNASFNCVPCAGSSSSVCTSCEQYKYYFNTNQNLCTTCANTFGQLCLTCNSSQCITCTAEYTLSSDLQSCFNGQCPVTYCKTCANNVSCQECDSIHKLYQGYCVCSLPNCEICSSGTCLTCFSGYSLDSSKTKCNFICIANCDVCTDLNSCTTCSLGYYYDSSVNQCKINCTAIDVNCISCASLTVCSSCSSNYTLSLSGTVCNLKCSDSNCITCSTNSNCTQCKSGYRTRLNSSTGNYGCSSDICQINYCVSCASSTTCAQCSSLYTLANNKKSCTPNCKLSNCAYCDTVSTCKTCNDGYKVASGSCTPICTISNCKLCSTSAICSQCEDGFLLSANGDSCSYNCGIVGCLNCISLTKCSSCYTGSTLSNNGKACVVNCQDGFFLNSTTNKCAACPTSNCLTCDSIGMCLSCKNLYYLNKTDFQCYPCSTISNCFNCDASSPVCTTCISDYYLINKVCVSQVSCTVTNCQACVSGSTTTCLTCISGYSLSSGGSACEQIVCSGNQYLVGSTCTCGAKSYFANGQCTACSDNNCISCTSSACISCALGYYPSGSDCVACSSNCQVCDSTGCTTCKDGFIKNGVVCASPSSTKTSSVANNGDTINCDTGCKVCDLDNATPPNAICREVADGYVLVSGKIYMCSSSCLTCLNSPNPTTGEYSICLTCPPGSNYNAGTCSRCTDKNALTCKAKDAGFSLTCKPGYNAEKGVCKACSDFCLKCGVSKSGKCDTGGCMTGYFQSKGFSTCVKCFNGCLVCASNPNNCLKCGDYKYLDGNVCKSCSDNCITCTNATVCTTCDIGYKVASDGSCKSLSIANCVDYDANFLCSKCDYSYVLANQNQSCVLSLDCNVTLTCTSCKEGYYLSSGNCLSCPQLSNCYICNQYKSTDCISCLNGYYPSSGACTKCPQTGCTTCISDVFCTLAATGYYLAVDMTNAYTGDVLVCEGLCATCSLSSLNCLTCKAGATLTGTNCLSNNNYDISFVGRLLGLDNSTSANTTSDYQVGFAITIISSFLQQLSPKFGFSSLKQMQKNLNFKSLTFNSVVIAMGINSDSMTSDPNTILTSATFTDLAVISHSVTTNSSNSSNINLGLVLGVAIPLGILLIAIIIILKVKSEKGEEESGLDGTEKEIEYQTQQF